MARRIRSTRQLARILLIDESAVRRAERDERIRREADGTWSLWRVIDSWRDESGWFPGRAPAWLDGSRRLTGRMEHDLISRAEAAGAELDRRRGRATRGRALNGARIGALGMTRAGRSPATSYTRLRHPRSDGDRGYRRRRSPARALASALIVGAFHDLSHPRYAAAARAWVDGAPGDDATGEVHTTLTHGGSKPREQRPSFGQVAEAGLAGETGAEGDD